MVCCDHIDILRYFCRHGINNFIYVDMKELILYFTTNVLITNIPLRWQSRYLRFLLAFFITGAKHKNAIKIALSWLNSTPTLNEIRLNAYWFSGSPTSRKTETKPRRCNRPNAKIIGRRLCPIACDFSRKLFSKATKNNRKCN